MASTPLGENTFKALFSFPQAFSFVKLLRSYFTFLDKESRQRTHILRVTKQACFRFPVVLTPANDRLKEREEESSLTMSKHPSIRWARPPSPEIKVGPSRLSFRRRDGEDRTDEDRTARTGQNDDGLFPPTVPFRSRSASRLRRGGEIRGDFLRREISQRTTDFAAIMRRRSKRELIRWWKF